MKKFRVYLYTEAYDVSVKADSREEAIEKAVYDYNGGEYSEIWKAEAEEIKPKE